MTRFPGIFDRRRSCEKLWEKSIQEILEVRRRHQKEDAEVKRYSHVVFFDTVGYALNDALNDFTMIAVQFVVSEAHETPVFIDIVPVDFNDPVVELFARRFPSVTRCPGQFGGINKLGKAPTYCSHSSSSTYITS